MSAKNWTPGPWKAQEYTGFSWDNKAYATWEIFACDEPQTYVARSNDDNPEVEANASLMATSPELYEALEAAMNFIESHVADPDITGEMARNYAALMATNPRAVMAKARGEA